MCLTLQGGRQASGPEPTALQRALERCGVQAAPQQRSKPAGGSEHMVTADRFERLLAEAEACVRARSVSPCMLKGVPGPGASPLPSNMPAPRPITPLQLGVNAVDAASGRSGLPRSFIGVDMGHQDGQHGIASFMLPAPAVSRRPGSAAVSDGRGRHASLAQAIAAAAAAEANSLGDEGEDLQGSPHSQYGGSASQADSVAHRGDAGRMLAAAEFAYGAEVAAGGNLHQDLHGYGDMPSHMQVGRGCRVLWPCSAPALLAVWPSGFCSHTAMQHQGCAKAPCRAAQFPRHLLTAVFLKKVISLRVLSCAPSLPALLIQAHSTHAI